MSVLSPKFVVQVALQGNRNEICSPSAATTGSARLAWHSAYVLYHPKSAHVGGNGGKYGKATRDEREQDETGAVWCLVPSAILPVKDGLNCNRTGGRCDRGGP